MVDFRRACIEFNKGIYDVPKRDNQIKEMWPEAIHTNKLKQYLNFWKISMNSSSGGGLALAVSKSSVVQKWWQGKYKKMGHPESYQHQQLYCFNFKGVLVHTKFKRFSLYLQYFAFYFFSYFSSSSGSVLSQPPQFAAAWPWSSQYHQNSDWESPGGGRTNIVKLFRYELQPKIKNGGW